jgi:hypothetical protein
LFVGLIVYLVLQPFTAAGRFVLTDVLVIFGMALGFFIPLSLFVRGVSVNSRPLPHGRGSVTRGFRASDSGH